MLLATTALASTISAPTISETKGKVTDTIQPSFYQILTTAGYELKGFLAQEVAKYGNPNDYFTLYNLIQCESSWDIDADNPNSTASGLAQFLDGTWNNYCEGNKDNPYDQIHCLVKAWNDNKQHWWNASRHCWKQYFTH